MLDAVVRECYEHLHGPVQPLSGQLNRRLTEYALDRTTAETTGALAGEPASAALADSLSSRFSLFDDAGLGAADALVAEFEGLLLDDRIATATSTPTATTGSSTLTTSTSLRPGVSRKGGRDDQRDWAAVAGISCPNPRIDRDVGLLRHLRLGRTEPTQHSDSPGRTPERARDESLKFDRRAMGGQSSTRVAKMLPRLIDPRESR